MGSAANVDTFVVMAVPVGVVAFPIHRLVLLVREMGAVQAVGRANALYPREVHHVPRHIALRQCGYDRMCGGCSRFSVSEMDILQ